MVMRKVEKKEEGRRKREEGRRKREEGGGMREEVGACGGKFARFALRARDGMGSE